VRLSLFGFGLSELGDLSRKFPVNQVREVGERLCANQRQPVDEEGRCGLHAEVEGKIHVPLDEFIELAAIETGGELVFIQSEVGCILKVNGAPEQVTAEKFVVIFPIGILFLGAERGDRGRHRIWMNGREGQIAVHEADLTGVRIQERLIGLFVEPSAEGTLEVAELDDGNWRIRRTVGWEAFGRDIVADELRLLGGCLHDGTGRRVLCGCGGCGGRNSAAPPKDISEQESDAERQDNERHIKMTALEGDELLWIGRGGILFGKYRDAGLSNLGFGSS
jgi:hypothetical protein